MSRNYRAPQGTFRRGSSNPFYLKFPASMFNQGTEKAYRIQTDARHVFWIPKSQVSFMAVDGVGDDAMIRMTVPEWLVKDKEIKDYIDPEWDACGRPD